MEAVQVDFKPFCEPDEDCRYALDQPFFQDGFEVATDARICVYRPTSEPDSAPDCKGRKRPSITKLIPAFEEIVADQPWPESFSNRESTPCIICGGAGHQECSLGHQHDCAMCKGSGRDHSSVELGSSTFDGKYLRLIETLPGPLTYGTKGDQMVVHAAGSIVVFLMGKQRD